MNSLYENGTVTLPLEAYKELLENERKYEDFLNGIKLVKTKGYKDNEIIKADIDSIRPIIADAFNKSDFSKTYKYHLGYFSDDVEVSECELLNEEEEEVMF